MAGPISRAIDFIDDRTGIRGLWRSAMDAEIEGGARWAFALGSTLLVLLIVQAVTGLLMMATYTPSVNGAWSSVFYLQNRVTMGWFVRGLHHYGASAVQIVLGLHLLQVVVFGAYKKPREVNWWLGLALLALVQGMGVTGYLLPWDQKGYWASKVVTGIAGSMPLLGESIQRFMVGGGEYGQATLSRLFMLHVGALPSLIVLVLVGHLALVRKHGRTPPERADRSRRDPYFPGQLARDVGFSVLAVGALAVITVAFQGAPLDAPADPGSDYPPRPEWYFLFLFQLLKYVPGDLEVLVTAGLPAVLGLFLFMLPLVDKKPSRAARARIPWVAPVLLGVVGVIALTALAVTDDLADADFQRARREHDARAQRSVLLAMRGIPPGGPLEMLRFDPLTHGADLFSRHCAQCHVLHGFGKRKAPDQTGFGSREWILALLNDPDADHFFGRTELAEGMPSQEELGEDALKKVTEFLFSLGREPQDPPVDESLLADGRRIFGEKCMKCHLFEGDGDFLGEGGPNLTGYASRTWIKRQIANPGAPTNYGELNDMPRFDDQLSDHDMNMLAAFLRLQRFETPEFPEMPPADEDEDGETASAE